MLLKLFYYSFFIYFMIENSFAQNFTCVAYNRNDLVSPCSVYNPSSWAYINLGEENLADTINYTNILIAGTTSLSSSPDCAPWISTWLCQNPLRPGRSVLRNCPVDGLMQPPPIAVPAPTCLDMCRNFFAKCKPSFDALGPAISALLPPTYCDTFTNDPLIQNGVSYPCWNVTPEMNPTPQNRTCPTYTHETRHYTCSPACPSPEYRHGQVFNIGLMQQIVGWIAFVASLVFATIFLCEPTFRKFPSSVIIFLLVGSVILALAFILATFVGGNVGDVWCGDVKYYPASKLNSGDRDINHGGLCTFQGWNIVLGTLLIAHWWVALSVNCALVIRSGLNYAVFEFSTKLQILYHALGWGLPLTYSIIAVAASKIDYEASNTFCFISSADNYAWQIALWFIPMGLCLVAGTAASVYAVFMLQFSKYRLKDSRHYGPTVRITLCALFFVTVITIIFASQIFTTVNQEALTVELIIYLVCIIGNGVESECRETMYSNVPVGDQYRLAAAATFFMAASGIFFILFFATHYKIFALLTGSSTERSNTKSPTRDSL